MPSSRASGDKAIRAGFLGDVPALAVWPTDIPPPALTPESFQPSLRRDAVYFVQAMTRECWACDAAVDGLEILGRIWFGGNRRRHKLRRCPACDADPVHSRLLFLNR